MCIKSCYLGTSERGTKAEDKGEDMSQEDTIGSCLITNWHSSSLNFSKGNISFNSCLPIHWNLIIISLFVFTHGFSSFGFSKGHTNGNSSTKAVLFHSFVFGVVKHDIPFYKPPSLWALPVGFIISNPEGHLNVCNSILFNDIPSLFPLGNFSCCR